jgi:hypothetical protein
MPLSVVGWAVTGKYYEVLYEMVLRHWNTTDSKGQSVLVPSIQYASPQPTNQGCLLRANSQL